MFSIEIKKTCVYLEILNIQVNVHYFNAVFALLSYKITEIRLSFHTLAVETRNLKKNVFIKIGIVWIMIRCNFFIYYLYYDFFFGRKTIANVSFAKKKIQYRKSCNS